MRIAKMFNRFMPKVSLKPLLSVSSIVEPLMQLAMARFTRTLSIGGTSPYLPLISLVMTAILATII